MTTVPLGERGRPGARALHGARARRPTQSDVARRAGVSPSTVSFVLNNTYGQSISPVTRQRVYTAAAELGYRPNRAAQGLSTGRTRSVGLVTHRVEFGEFAFPLIAGAHEECVRRGSLLLHTAGDRQLSWTTLIEMLDHQVDAIIVSTSGTRRVNLPEEVTRTPTVLANCFSPGNAVPAILPDEVAGGRCATEMLLRSGHREIAYLTGEPGAWATRARLRGHRSALRSYGVDPRSQIVAAGNYRADSGYELTRTLLRASRPPTAVACGNDRMAVGALLALLEHGLRVPEDVSLVGYDDQPHLAGDLTPALSTVALPYYAMGRLAAELILAGEHAAAPPRTYLQCVPVPRSSIGPPRADVRGG